MKPILNLNNFNGTKKFTLKTNKCIILLLLFYVWSQHGTVTHLLEIKWCPLRIGFRAVMDAILFLFIGTRVHLFWWNYFIVVLYLQELVIWISHTPFGDKILATQSLLWSCFRCDFIHSLPKNGSLILIYCFLFVLCIRGGKL